MTVLHSPDRRDIAAEAYGLRRVSWGAVLAGVTVALATNLVLNLLGVGVGAASLNPAGDGTASAAAISIGAAAWWTLAGVVASLVGGIVAGRLAGPERRASGGWHGLTSWAVTTLVVFYLLTSAVGGVLGGVYGTVSGAISGATQATGATAKTALGAAAPALAGLDDPLASLETEVRDATGGQDPAALRDAAVTAVRALVTGDEAQANDARERAAAALAAARQIPIEQARTDVQRYEEQYKQAVETAKTQATAAAEATATAVSRGALLSAVSLVVGALAGWLGGAVGARRSAA